MKWQPDNRFLCGFLHIFSSSYSAGYYSYKYAEMMAADAFAAFVEAGESNEAQVGSRYRDTVSGETPETITT